MKSRFLLSSILCFLMLAAPHLNAQDSLESSLEDSDEEVPQDQKYKIGIGDLLQVEVYDEKDLTKEVRVLTDGYISLPLLGPVKAAGRTVGRLEGEITRMLGEKYLVNPQVTVFVKKFSNIFVFGEVKKPGSFPIYGKMTVFEAITLAGGFTEVANPTKVKVVRQKGSQETSFEVDTQRLTKKGDASADPELRAGDRVIVPRSFF
jgi:polysaccharide biosynthesis/export protein